MYSLLFYCFLLKFNGKMFLFVFAATSFPTPMEEPKKVLRGHYLGTAMVPKPTGRGPHNNSMYNKRFNPFALRVPPESIVCYSHTFENNLGMKEKFTKYLKESCCFGVC